MLIIPCILNLYYPSWGNLVKRRKTHETNLFTVNDTNLIFETKWNEDVLWDDEGDEDEGVMTTTWDYDSDRKS